MTAITVRPIQPRIGAEIEGVDLARPLTTEVRDAIYQAVLDHGVIFIRDQDITREQHIEFGRSFGELVKPLLPLEGYPEILMVKSSGAKPSGADMWHSDHSDRQTPPFGSILRARDLPSLGGDTLWSSAVAAYDALPQALKEKIGDLMCVHDFRQNMARAHYGPTKEKEILENYLPIVKPVVAAHPDTGKPLLFVNRHFTTHIVGLEKAESDAILRILFDEISKPDHQVRLSWRVNTFAFWDNRAVQHYAVYDYDEPRYMERVTVMGQCPTLRHDEARVPFKLPELIS